MIISKYINLAVLVLIAFAFGFTVLNYPSSPPTGAEKASVHSVQNTGDIPIAVPVSEFAQIRPFGKFSDYYAAILPISRHFAVNKRRAEIESLLNAVTRISNQSPNSERFKPKNFTENLAAFKGFNIASFARAAI